MKPGIYEVLSTDDAYLDMLALESLGFAMQIGERFLEGGVIERVYLVEDEEIRSNPAIRIGTGFFSNALKDYSEWELKWWRECIQNSVDAGATRIELHVEELENGNWLVSCEDNGRGMSEDVLFNKFLVLGESGKESREGMIGGFGKAKELLVLPWIQWRITTRDNEVIGDGIDYEIGKVESIGGTVIEAIMPADKHTDEKAAMEFLQRCDVPGVKFYINGVQFTEKLRKGSEVKSLSYGTLYRNKSKTYGEVYVRARGMYMFTAGTFGAQYGTLIAEVTADTTELLTANRDSFRDWQSGWEIQNFVNEIVTEGEEALRSKKGLTTDIWKGSVKISTEQGMTDILQALGPTPPVEPGGSLRVTEEAATNVVLKLDFISEAIKPKSGMLNIGPASGDVAKEIIHEPIKGASSVENMARALVWQPDFMVRNEIEYFRVPGKFKPEDMTPTIAALAKVWAEACRWVFIQLGKAVEYGVGFVFSGQPSQSPYYVAAMYKKDEEGKDWLLLNPVRGGGKPGKLLSKTDREDLKEIYASAIHEVTHMADGYSAHDSSFAAALTHNFAVCSDGFSTMVKISKAIKIAGAAKKGKKVKLKKTTPVTLCYDGSTFYVYPDDKKVVKAAEEAMNAPAYTTTFSSNDPATVMALFKIARDTLPSAEVNILKQGDYDNVMAMWPTELVRNLIAAANDQYLGSAHVLVRRSSHYHP